jgi:hypothetical protein
VKLIVARMVKKISAFNRNGMFIVVPFRERDESITHSHTISCTSIFSLLSLF